MVKEWKINGFLFAKGSTHGPLQVLLFFGQIRPGAYQGRGQNRSLGGPLL